MSLKYDPATIHKPKQKDDMGRVEDGLLTMQGGEMGSVEIDHIKLVGRAIFALRGFGEFEVRWGVGAYGKDLNGRRIRLSSYGKEEVLAAGVRCLITNRMAYGLSTLKIGTYSKWQAGHRAVTLSDFIPDTAEKMGNQFRANAKMEPTGRYPYSIDFPKRSIKNQNLVADLRSRALS